VRFLKPLLFVAGAILLAVLVHRVGTEPILATLRTLAWWQFILICLPYGVIRRARLALRVRARSRAVLAALWRASGG